VFDEQHANASLYCLSEGIGFFQGSRSGADDYQDQSADQFGHKDMGFNM
jgi:hypothetical protein